MLTATVILVFAVLSLLPELRNRPALPGGLASAAQWANQPAPEFGQQQGAAGAALRPGHVRPRRGAAAAVHAAAADPADVVLRASGRWAPPAPGGSTASGEGSGTPGSGEPPEAPDLTTGGARFPGRLRRVRPRPADGLCESGDVVSLLARASRRGRGAAQRFPAVPLGWLAGAASLAVSLVGLLGLGLALVVVQTLDPAGGLGVGDSIALAGRLWLLAQGGELDPRRRGRSCSRRSC